MRNPAIFFLERPLNTLQLNISGVYTANGIIHGQGGQKPAHGQKVKLLATFWQAYEDTINHQRKVIEFVRR